MPNRIIKESINESRGLGQVSPFSQDLYKRLITYCDDYGRFNADVEMIRVHLYPREISSVTIEDVDEAISELCGIDKVRFYTHRSRPDEIFGYMVGWEKHQRIRNLKNKFPEPEDEGINEWYYQKFVPLKFKTAIYKRDDFTCKACGLSLKIAGVPAKRLVRLLNGAMHIEHIVPVSAGGKCTEENLRLLCEKCNRTKTRPITPEEILEEVSSSQHLVPQGGKNGRVANNGGEASHLATTRGESRQFAAKAKNEQSQPIEIIGKKCKKQSVSPQLAASRRKSRPESESNPNPDLFNNKSPGSEKCGSGIENNLAPIGAPAAEIIKTKKKSNHFSKKIGQHLDSILMSCEKIGKLPVKSGKPFNPYQWVTQKTNASGHPQAIEEGLNWLIQNWPDVVNAWTFVNATFKTKNPKYNERDNIQQSQAFKSKEISSALEFKNLWSRLQGNT